uniref:HDC02380 n=1 Tax=Drosophila melanogaster TaxID=7227 RepID=Q6IHK1_DROME|nr:TPA_inf: HDC02380 [Drosophila melanogaster]
MTQDEPITEQVKQFQRIQNGEKEFWRVFESLSTLGSIFLSSPHVYWSFLANNQSNYGRLSVNGSFLNLFEMFFLANQTNSAYTRLQASGSRLPDSRRSPYQLTSMENSIGPCLPVETLGGTQAGSYLVHRAVGQEEEPSA